jgi:hypothetical protein
MSIVSGTISLGSTHVRSSQQSTKGYSMKAIINIFRDDMTERYWESPNDDHPTHRTVVGFRVEVVAEGWLRAHGLKYRKEAKKDHRIEVRTRIGEQRWWSAKVNREAELQEIMRTAEDHALEQAAQLEARGFTVEFRFGPRMLEPWSSKPQTVWLDKVPPALRNQLRATLDNLAPK